MVNANGGTHRSHAPAASFDLRQKGRYGALYALIGFDTCGAKKPA
jgi:hypothetical protein